MVKRILSFFALAILYFAVTVAIHETGHAITGKLVGLGKPVVHVWPGIEVYPNLRNLSSMESWPERSVAYVSFVNSTKTLTVHFTEQNGLRISVPSVTWRFVHISHVERRKKFLPLIRLMGSGATYLVSLLCLFLLWAYKLKGRFKIFVTLGALLVYDLLCYAIFPVFFDMPHLLIVGGHQPEPVLALVGLGLSFEMAVTFILVICLMHISALCYVLRKRK